jgi:SAM-dependent methyltransferase
MTAVPSFTPHDPYTPDRALGYQRHHDSSLRRRLTSWREQRCLGAALKLAGEPERVLDVPCGAGRFWRTFSDHGVRELIAVDFSPAMLGTTAGLVMPGAMTGMVVRGDAFRIPLAAGAVDFVACMRFVHHLSMPEYRRTVLDELRRVSRRHVAVSLWVDGNYAGNRRLAKGAQTPRAGYGGRHCFHRQGIEAEFRAAGFRVVRRFDVWPRISMWRLYLLERA